MKSPSGIFGAFGWAIVKYLKLYVFLKQNNVIVTYNVNENEYIIKIMLTILKNSYMYVFELKISLQHSGFSYFYVTIIVTCNFVQTAYPIIIMNWY